MKVWGDQSEPGFPSFMQCHSIPMSFVRVKTVWEASPVAWLLTIMLGVHLV